MNRYHYSIRNTVIVCVSALIITAFCFTYVAPWWVSSALSLLNGFVTGLIFPIRKRVRP